MFGEFTPLPGPPPPLRAELHVVESQHLRVILTFEVVYREVPPGVILEIVDQMTVAGGRWHWTIATRPAGSDVPLNVWWSSMGQKVE